MRVGFIGVGGIAGMYRKLLREQGVEIAAVYDVNAEQTAKVAAEDGGQACADYRGVLDAPGVQAVLVCIPPFAHETQVAEAAERGLGVFVAKPVALDLDTARRTAAAIEQAGVVNQSGYMWRSSDVVAAARELLGDTPLGMATGETLVNVPPTAWWTKKAMSGGQVVEQATHVVDLMRLFMGEIQSVSGVGHVGLQPDRTDFEDCTLATFRFASGAIGSLAATNAGGIGRYSLVLAGRDICVDINCGDQAYTARLGKEKTSYQGTEDGYRRQLATFVKAVEEGDQSLVPTSYADAAQTLAATLAFNQSLAQDGAFVDVPAR